MQGSSRGALVAATESLEAALRSGADGSALGDELFAVITALDSSATLRRAVADPSREPAAKAGIAAQLFGPRVSPTALSVLTSVVQQRWSTERDLADALENLGVQAVLADADRCGRGDAVEDELFRFERIVAASPELRDVVTDRTVAGSAKVELVDRLLADKTSAQTQRLARQAVAAPRGRRFARIIEHYLAIAAARRSQVAATVTTAVALDPGQRDRLAAALTSIYGRPVHVNPVIDPAVVGGIRVQVGDEVVDGTVLRKLDSARRHMGA